MNPKNVEVTFPTHYWYTSRMYQVTRYQGRFKNVREIGTMFEMWEKGIAHENITVVPNNAGNNIGYDADRNAIESFFLTYFIRKVATYVSDGKATLTLCFV